MSQTALQAGSLTYNGPRQIYLPKPIILGVSTGREETFLTLHLRVPAPDSRCRIKISVIFFPGQGNAIPDLANLCTIWVSANEEDTSGISGSAGRSVPVTDVEGTSDTPTQFPVATGLSGYSREFVTAADWLEADVAIGGLAATAGGVWALQTRIQPDAVTFTWPEWDAIRRLFTPQVSATSGRL
jgi:hypothetical protein